MKYKIGDIVEYKFLNISGIGKIVAIDNDCLAGYLVHSKDIKGHSGYGKYLQDNFHNLWFGEKQLKLVENFDKGKQENSKDELIKELTEIYNELTEIPELKHVYAISMKVVTKALLHLLRDTKEDTKKEPKFTLQCPITGFYFNNINIWTHPNEYKERMNGNYTEETKNRCRFTQYEIDRLPNQEFIKLLNKIEIKE